MIKLAMEHEHINDRSVALCVKGAKLTGRMLAQAMQAFLKKLKEPTFAAKASLRLNC